MTLSANLTLDSARIQNIGQSWQDRYIISMGYGQFSNPARFLLSTVLKIAENLVAGLSSLGETPMRSTPLERCHDEQQ